MIVFVSQPPAGLSQRLERAFFPSTKTFPYFHFTLNGRTTFYKRNLSCSLFTHASIPKSSSVLCLRVSLILGFPVLYPSFEVRLFLIPCLGIPSTIFLHSFFIHAAFCLPLLTSKSSDFEFLEFFLLAGLLACILEFFRRFLVLPHLWFDTR